MKRNYAQFFALLNRLEGEEKEELKEVIVDQYTGGRTSSLREMTDSEYRSMIGELKARVNKKEESLAQELVLRDARSSVLKIMMDMGINTGDWGAIDAFCLQPRIAGKRFYYLSVGELGALRKKLLSIRDKGYKHRARRTPPAPQVVLPVKGQMPS